MEKITSVLVLARTNFRRNTYPKAEGRITKRPKKMDGEEEQALQQKLNRLKQEHRDLDSAIRALELTGKADQLQLTRLKKQKLSLKDKIASLEDQLFPDIIA
ncbi:MAG: YdcH family protein [Methyloligellaceae bacterium]